MQTITVKGTFMLGVIDELRQQLCRYSPVLSRQVDLWTHDDRISIMVKGTVITPAFHDDHAELEFASHSGRYYYADPEFPNNFIEAVILDIIDWYR